MTQCRLSTSDEYSSFVGLITNDLLHGLCDSALSPIDHSLETLASERKQHSHSYVLANACDIGCSASTAGC